ncbi:uncharacterized protein LOC118561455 [Fundulus heteroclitus]|uniref:uncharacterized protein LOC118561455 n=1 Tax=Fundulus heteroclitus TaxID=8078 RepID=UPI00165A2F92|nr:uncharacterized protein LOC118561455 [Fundulus heteroclitus]
MRCLRYKPQTLMSLFDDNVQVRSPKTNTTVQTYAFLDPGSTATFCTESLARRLQLKGKRTSIQLQTMGHKDIVSTNIISGLQVAAFNKNDFIQLPDVMTQKRMPVSKRNVPQQEDINQWPYLQSIKLHNLDADVDLLIGTDAPKVMEPWELINSQDDGPYAVWTRVGWVINGPLRSERRKTDCHAFTANRISVQNLETMLIEQYNHDFNEKTSQEQIEMSREDIKFMDIMNNTAHLINGHYCIDLPFKAENSTLPVNRCIAEQRLQSLKRKFDKSITFKKDYIAFMDDMICNGYAEVVPSDRLVGSEGKVWYIPHHGVYHPRKGKLRVVFDCAATFKGTSLNCQLLQGPDLTNSVVEVLVRFRQEPIAIMADIQAMFHQVYVPEKHRDFLRFLWWPNGNTSQVPQEYRMTVHLFGAVSSPSCANYALRRTAEDNAQQFPVEVVSTIKHNFYVDDCLKSLPTADEASRGMKAEDFMEQSKWINGPKFLLESEDKWPKLEVRYDSLPADDSEIKKNVTINAVVEKIKCPTSVFISYFSSWAKLKTSVAWVLKLKKLLILLSQKRQEFSAMLQQSAEDGNTKQEKVSQKMQQFKARLKKQCLTSEDLAKDEHFIIQFEQHRRFGPEIT